MNNLELIKRISAKPTASASEVEALLCCSGDELKALYGAADLVRRENMGDEIYLRGIIEFSNHCRKSCDYCGIRGPNRTVPRYRMTPEEIVATACQAAKLGNTTVVLQSGEDTWFTCARMCDIVRGVKEQARVAVTLSIGERSLEELVRFKEAGCDRYLLRFETSDRGVFKRIHPDDDFDERIQCLHDLRNAGIQVGSGFMIGLPGGDRGGLARDILFATALDLDMIGCGPFLPHPDTPLSAQPLLDDREMYFKVIALLRLMNPRAHIPATTAFDALFEGGRDLVLTRGANVFMPNVTPQKYRQLYQLYPNKPCVDEDSGQCSTCVAGRVARLGRTIGKGPGHGKAGITVTGTGKGEKIARNSIAM